MTSEEPVLVMSRTTLQPDPVPVIVNSFVSAAAGAKVKEAGENVAEEHWGAIVTGRPAYTRLRAMLKE